MAVAIIAAALSACSGPPVSRQGPPEVREVTTTVARAREALRDAVVAAMRARDLAPPPVTGMWLVDLDTWSPDWAVRYADPGGYLAPYVALPATARHGDLLLEDFTDRSWLSEYETASGPVPFRCGFVLHFAAVSPDSTEVSVYELTPEVTVGLHWALAHEGIGFAKVDDIRLVEPTVTDRQTVARWLTGLGKR